MAVVGFNCCKDANLLIKSMTSGPDSFVRLIAVTCVIYFSLWSRLCFLKKY